MRDVLVIGGGTIGLAIAVELRTRGASVTLLCRSFNEAASRASAGTLAPQAEAIPQGALLDLCLSAREMYGEWTEKLEALTGIDTGYWPCGILSPRYRRESESEGSWLERDALVNLQPGLGEDVVGGFWYPDDAQVDNRALFEALQQAARTVGVDCQEGVEVEAIRQQRGKIAEVKTGAGTYRAEHYVVAGGAWTRTLLPLPVYPVKGQMLSLQMPQVEPGVFPIQQVLFGSDIYLVPRRNGRLLVGATVEEGDWQGYNTPRGIQSLLDRAIRLYPGLQDWPLHELWWGFRPATPDKLPILGRGLADNLILATGHYRYGILLAPMTAKLLADLITGGQESPWLQPFAAERFLAPRAPQLQVVERSPIAHLEGEEMTPEVPPLTIAGRSFRSRLMTGTGKYPDLETMRRSVAASGCEIVTVAVRRVQTKAPGHEGLAEALDWSQVWMLPNTAGCKTAEEAIRVAKLGREMAKLLGQEDNNFVKLEVIPDAKYLLPDPVGTLQAAEQLVKAGFAVLPYINADPMLARRLEEAGCATVMPLGSPIGSGQGIQTAANIRLIIEDAKVPVVVDAGIGTPSEAAMAMELGADALLVNSAIALARDPVSMARAMGMATVAGYLARHAGRIPVKNEASASSPVTGTISGS